jgi:hypothetical protein
MTDAALSAPESRRGGAGRAVQRSGIVSIGPRRDRFCLNGRYDAAPRRMKRRAKDRPYIPVGITLMLRTAALFAVCYLPFGVRHS